MKKISIFLLALFMLSGCSTAVFSNNWNENGLSFQYPDTLAISIDQFEPYYNGKTIFVEQKPITEFIQGCIEADKWRDKNASEYDLEKKYKEILRQIRNGEINKAIENFDSLSCNFTMGNIKATQVTIGDTHGIIYNKALAQDFGSMTVFYTQVLLVDSKDMVYSIIFPYGFDSNAEYINSIKNEYGEAYPTERTEEKWNEVFNYFKDDREILSTELQGFSENRKTIENIINTIKIN